MKPFDVLDRKLNIHQHCLIEASAGTGKTFSIENIVTRLVIEKEGIPIENILVVTFTQMATQDLKSRIRLNMERNLHLLKQKDPSLPDYLQQFVEEKQEESIIKRLEKALFNFDQAQIFTIHGFCARMLKNHFFESDLGVNAIAQDEQIANSDVLRVIRDYLRIGIKEETLSSAQLAILLKKHKSDIKKLEKSIFRTITSGFTIDNPPIFKDYFDRFILVISSLHYRASSIVEDFETQWGSYRKIGNGEELLQKIKDFAQLFEQTEWSYKDFDSLIKEGILFLEALDEKLLKARGKKIDSSLLHYPSLREELLTLLNPLVTEARDYGRIYGKICYECHTLLEKNLYEKEIFRFDDLLKKMFHSLQNEDFIHKVRQNYVCAIIDEFQDTDPLQWNIFKTLFLEKGYLYLVGDPKQSIYGFRQADIYTYLDAAHLLGKEHRFSLETNYRSQPTLVQDLNRLFQVSKFIELPKIKKSLDYPEVKANEKTPEKDFSDSKGSVHFFLLRADSKKRGYSLIEWEEESYFPYMLEQIEFLHTSERVNYSHCAILVRDHFQAARVGEFLKKHSIPITLQKSGSLTSSLALGVMKEFIRALLSPRDESLVKVVLGGPLFRWGAEKLKDEENDPALNEEVVSSFFELRQALVLEGFGRCYRLLMESISSPLLQEEDSLGFYQDFEQIAHLLMEYECQKQVAPPKLLEFLEQFDLFEEDEEIMIKRRMNPDKEAVQILTLHSSKGLEFEIVFALGLINRTPAHKDLIPNEEEVLTSVQQLPPRFYEQYCEENDAEKMRQLYVTLTRAKWRVYVPAILGLIAPEEGTASPMELYLNKVETSLEEFLEKNQISYEWVTEKKVFHVSEKEKRGGESLVAPLHLTIPGKPLVVSSFTQLTKNKAGLIKENIPHSLDVPLKNRHTLPAGNKTGLLFHSLLENISFHEASRVSEWGEKILSGTDFEEWQDVFVEIVESTLSYPLFDGTHSFCLQDVDSFKMYRENEFIYSLEAVSDHSLTSDAFSEFLKYGQEDASEGFLKGVMDLVFEHQGKYYLVDWKSNWLGPTLENYDSPSLYQAMKENHYFLQAAIYTTALKRFLKIVEEREFEECFGGIFYFFLRGVNASKKTGVYFFRN